MFCSETIEATEDKAKAPEIGPAFASESLFAMKIVVEWPGVAAVIAGTAGTVAASAPVRPIAGVVCLLGAMHTVPSAVRSVSKVTCKELRVLCQL